MPKKVVRPEIRTVDKETGEVIVTPAVVQEDYPQPKLERFWKTQYNHDTRAESKRHATVIEGESMTEQAPKDQVDINHILAKFGVGAVRALAPNNPAYLDVPEDLSLAGAIEQLRAGRDAFEALPKNLKQHFETIENYVDFVDQAVQRKDKKTLQAYGLMPKDPVAPPEEPVAPRSQKGGDQGSPPDVKKEPSAPKP